MLLRLLFCLLFPLLDNAVIGDDGVEDDGAAVTEVGSISTADVTDEGPFLTATKPPPSSLLLLLLQSAIKPETKTVGGRRRQRYLLSHFPPP